MSKQTLIGTIIILATATLLPACASISESECQAGNWADIGYRDGVNGKARDRIADYVQTCGEYGAGVDRSSYLSSYEAGLTHYCVYDKGFELGKNGSSYNAVCSGPLASNFRAGYEDGHTEYELRQKYNEFENSIDSKRDALADVTSRIKNPDTSADEKNRLRKKKKRLEGELEDLRWNFRSFKRKYDLDF